MGGSEELVDILIRDGLTDPITGEAMGLQAERVIAAHGISRPELDEVAVRSHRRAAQARDNGDLDTYMVPIEVKRKRESVQFGADEGIRDDTTREALSVLKPAFKPDGLLTAGNSSQISDGSAALLLASKDAISKYGLKPLARLLGSSIAAGESWRFTEAPVPAVHRLLDRLGMQIDDFDLVENNEAFAVNGLLFERMLSVDPEKLNVFGGAIAMGHPIGASGARIIVTLLSALKRRDQNLGLAAICHGTGGGTALALERV
jgi:acetyl-CoA C-acetyltransferase